MADYPTVVFPTGGYSAVHKGWNMYGHATPNFEIMEGMRFGQFYPAPYLPTVRLERTQQDYIVIGGGKAVALDSNGWLVPAGFKLLIAAGKGTGPQYTATDIGLGILNAQGNVPAVGDFVIDAVLDASVTVGHCLGVASYDAYLLSGADPTNPATYRFHNYNRQTGVAVLTDYLLEFPVEPLKRTQYVQTVALRGTVATTDLDKKTVVSSTIEVTLNGERVAPADWTFGNGTGAGGLDRLTWSAGLQAILVNGDTLVISFKFSESYYAAPWTGMATWKGAAKPGDKVTFDADSNWVAYTPGAVSATNTGDRSAQVLAAIALTLDVVGQVVKVDTNFPKQFLDRVKSAFDPRLTGPLVDGLTGQEMVLDRQAGSATDGLPHNIYFAGGDASTGVVRFNLNIT